MLATDLRGLRRQCAEAEAAYWAEVDRVKGVQDEIRRLGVKETMEDASAFVERAREVSGGVLESLREAQDAIEKGDSEIIALETRRKEFENATKESKAMAEELEAAEARLERMHEESRKYAEETSRIMRTCVKLSGTPVSVQSVWKRWRNFAKASIFDKKRLTRQTFVLWRRGVVSSLLAVAAADRLRPAAAIRRWRNRVVSGSLRSERSSRISVALEKRIEDMGLRNRRRGMARAVLYRWHNVTERANYRRRILAWQNLRVSRAVERFRLTSDDDRLPPPPRQRRLVRRIKLELFFSTMTRCTVRLSLTRWRSATKRMVAMSLALATLKRRRREAILSRRRLATADSFILTKALKRWSRRRAVWAIRRAFRLLEDNARRRRLATATRWRSFVLSRRCFAAWRVEWMRRRKIRDAEDAETMERAQRAREDELRRSARAAAASQDVQDLAAREKELEEKLARNNLAIASLPEFDRDKLEAALRAKEDIQAARRQDAMRTLCARLSDPTGGGGAVAAAADLIAFQDVPGATEMMAEVVSLLEAQLESVRADETALARENDSRNARLAGLDAQLEAVKADAKATIAKYTKEIREQFDANAALQVKLAKHKSESHLRLRIRKLCRENDKAKHNDDGAAPSSRRGGTSNDHLHHSLILALQAKRDYLCAKKPTGGDEDDGKEHAADAKGGTSGSSSESPIEEFFEASQQLLAKVDPPLPPLPPLRDKNV